VTHPRSSSPDDPPDPDVYQTAPAAAAAAPHPEAVGDGRASTAEPGVPASRSVVRLFVAVVTAGLLVVGSAGPAVAAPPASLDEVISRITTWIVRLAFGLATLFITYGAVRLLTAGGDPGAAEKAKAAIRAAALGYGLALLAPLIVTVLSSFVS
jgi:hypothetical protein